MLAFVVAPPLALGLAALMPVTLAVTAVAVFGVAHLALETRYVVGRVSTHVPWTVLAWLLVPLTLIAALRLMPHGRAGGQAEVLVALGLVALAWAWCLRARPLTCAGGLAVVATLAVGGVRRPDLYAVVLVQLHNLTPLAFLWEWSRGRGTVAGRRLFRAAQLGWAVVVPVAILVGLVDHGGWGWPAWSGDRTVEQVAHAYSPAGWGGPWALRLLTVFCFGQLMHYVIWCGYLPAVASDDHERAKRAGAFGPLFRPRLFAPIALGAAVVIGALQLASGTLGRRWYSAVASYHAYLEYPVLVAFLATAAGGTVALTRRHP